METFSTFNPGASRSTKSTQPYAMYLDHTHFQSSVHNSPRHVQHIPPPILSLSLSLSPLSRVACWSAKPSYWLDCVPLITPAVNPSVTISHLEDSSAQNSSGSFSSHVLSTSSPEPWGEELIETHLGLRTQQALVLSPLISVSLCVAAHCRKTGSLA